MERLETPVLIVGGGPTGLALAADLTSKGVRSMVVETRTEPTAHPRATLLGSRSMEYYRRLGLDEQIVRSSLPREHGYRIVFATRLSGKLLHAHDSPSPNQYMTAHREMRTDLPESAWTPYYKVQIGQHALEPIVKSWLLDKGMADVRYGTEFVAFEQDAGGVTSVIRDLASGQETTVRSRFLVACDGGRSAIKATLGIPYTGRGAMRRNVSYLFRSKAFLEHATAAGWANLYFIFRPGAFGVFTNINGGEIWNYQNYVLEGEAEGSERDPAEQIRDAMGADFPFEILQVMHWSHHQSVADRFRAGNVFLAGDAAHLFCPTGGIGMNTGIADAFDLGWKLTAALRGWGGPHLLDSYEWERRAIAIRNTIAAASNADRIDAMMKVTPAGLEDDTPQGQELRQAFGRRLRQTSKQFNTAGLHLGYRYSDSFIVVPDGTPEPPDDPRIVSQSTWPGCRAPHVWLEPGKSTLDLFDGTGYVLVALPGAPDTAALERTAAERCIPFKRVDVNERARALYERALVLVRPDGSVCWRGEALPEQVNDIWDTVAGFRAPV
ncbi:FAD-dependent monooxygenase [Ramlibacter tataouinensis]|uniref:FAD-dependent monooxygenase n=1 Tax=Ramlibacter tataouinensis TaxID=94132 RepID=UPI0022F3A168|nr:FAD-dependent monooxygenase [Ramlibacter tataouinensis]WBY01541.1 FAD-dependent monooxygenase [Ramlibacter tataouinensis]